MPSKRPTAVASIDAGRPLEDGRADRRGRFAASCDRASSCSSCACDTTSCGRGSRPARPSVRWRAISTDPPPIVQRGLDVSRAAFGKIAERARGIGARTAIVLVPARFQTDDADLRLPEDGGGRRRRRARPQLVVPSISRRARAAGPADPRSCSPSCSRSRIGSGLFFQRTVHLTPRGHDVVSGRAAGLPAGGGSRAAAGVGR